jgi:hypothetical protein
MGGSTIDSLMPVAVLQIKNPLNPLQDISFVGDPIGMRGSKTR